MWLWLSFPSHKRSSSSTCSRTGKAPHPAAQSQHPPKKNLVTSSIKGLERNSHLPGDYTNFSTPRLQRKPRLCQLAISAPSIYRNCARFVAEYSLISRCIRCNKCPRSLQQSGGRGAQRALNPLLRRTQSFLLICCRPSAARRTDFSFPCSLRGQKPSFINQLCKQKYPSSLNVIIISKKEAVVLRGRKPV